MVLHRDLHRSRGMLFVFGSVSHRGSFNFRFRVGSKDIRSADLNTHQAVGELSRRMPSSKCPGPGRKKITEARGDHNSRDGQEGRNIAARCAREVGQRNVKQEINVERTPSACAAGHLLSCLIVGIVHCAAAAAIMLRRFRPLAKIIVCRIGRDSQVRSGSEADIGEAGRSAAMPIFMSPRPNPGPWPACAPPAPRAPRPGPFPDRLRRPLFPRSFPHAS